MRSQVTRSRTSCGLRARTRRPISRASLTSAAVTYALKSPVRGLTSLPHRVVAPSIATPKFPPEVLQNKSISTATMAQVKAIITPEFLAGVRDFWFEHITSRESLILPDQKLFMPWFSGGDFDKRCVEKFHPALDAIKDTGIDNAEDLLKIVELRSSLDWLSLILLLDQMPRNCYRGDDSKIVFNYFDPIALGVAKAAAAENIPHGDPEIRWYLCRRIWFNLPYTHSESNAMHEIAEAGVERLKKDMYDLLERPEVEGQDEHRARAAEVYKGCDEQVHKIAEMTVKAETDHFDIVKKFGRYPHRNGPLGRQATAEEAEFLANGGATFAPPPQQAQD